MTTCQYCHKELVNSNAYEDGLYSIIGMWLKEATCIDWYKFNSSLRKPDEQFGMMFLHSYNQRNKSQKVVQVGEDLETASFCLAITETEELVMDLFVVQEQGEPVRCDQGLERVWSRSASDVLKQVNSRVDIVEFNRLLSDNQIRIATSPLVDVRIVEREKNWEYWSEASFQLTSCRKTSYPISGEELVYCVELCDGTPICKAKEFPECQ